MIISIIKTLNPIFLIISPIIFILLLSISIKYPQYVFSMSIPIYILFDLIKFEIPISISLLVSICIITSFLGSLLGGYKYYFGKFDFYIIVLFIIMIIAVTYSSSSSYGTIKVLLFGLTLFPLIIVFPKIIRTKKDCIYLIKVIRISLFLYLIISIVFLFLKGFHGRFGSIHEPIFAGQILGAGFINYLLMYFEKKKIIILMISFLFLIMAFLTGTRAVFIAILVIIIINYLFIKELLFEKKINYKEIIFFVITLILVFLFSNNIYFFTSDEIFNSRIIKLIESESINDRLQLYKLAIESFINNPIKGIGTGGFKSVAISHIEWYRYKDIVEPNLFVYPHNVFLEILCELGIFGFIIFCVILGITINNMIRMKKYYKLTGDKKIKKIISFSLVNFLYGFLVAQTSLDMSRLFFFWLGVAFVESSKNLINKRRVKNVQS